MIGRCFSRSMLRFTGSTVKRMNYSVLQDFKSTLQSGKNLSSAGSKSESSSRVPSRLLNRPGNAPAAAAAAPAAAAAQPRAAEPASEKRVILEVVATAAGGAQVVDPAIAELREQIAVLLTELRETQNLLRQHLGQPPVAAPASPKRAAAGAAKPDRYASNDPLAYRRADAPDAEAEAQAPPSPKSKPAASAAPLDNTTIRRKLQQLPSKGDAPKTQAPTTEWKPKFDADGCHPDIKLMNDNTLAKCAVDGDEPECYGLCYVGEPPFGTTELKFRVERLGVGMVHVCPPDTALDADGMAPIDHEPGVGSVPGKLSFQGVTLAFTRSGDLNIHTPQGGNIYQVGVEAGHIITANITRDQQSGTSTVTFKVGKKARVPRSYGPYTLKTTDIAVAVGLGWKGTAIALI